MGEGGPSGPGEGFGRPLETAAREGKIETRDLGGGFTGWRNGTAEGRTQITEAARRTGKTGLRWTVVIDHLHDGGDGGEGGKYPIGWPRISMDFKPGQLVQAVRRG